ncbi:NAD-binding Rossmann fold oxidoreductase [Vararia minispora EC-137]|uniref:NAD-binding Rossmann fold oxidoreductase n=1 Tax=Vararia minispora EC-137 TaxID=1314806 RepID=A0ACB8QAB9_9AGAM|nr:NAD-binding Rossmann fold oxidoreductase [Vararia minispora EC-137]
MPIKLGVVGLSKNGGAWASMALVPPLFEEPLKSEYTLTALSTSSADSASASAEHFGAAAGAKVKPYSSATDAIASDTDVEMVAVSVKAPSHLAAALPIINAGKDIFVEWPAGKNLEETRQLAQRAKEKNVRSMVGLQGWQTPLVKKVKQLVESGRIGKVTSSTWVAYKLPAVPYWYPFTAASHLYTLDPEQGGALADIWIGHNLSMISRALGPLTTINASAVKTVSEIVVGPAPGAKLGDEGVYTVPAQAPDQYGVSGVFTSGALFVGSWRALSGGPFGGPALLWTIDGTDGQIRVESEVPTAGFPQIFAPSELFVNGERVDLAEENEGMPMTGRAWAEFAKGAEGEYPTLDDALLLRKQVEAIKVAAETGNRVQVSSI